MNNHPSSDFSVTITGHNLTSESSNDCSSMGCIMMKGDDRDYHIVPFRASFNPAESSDNGISSMNNRHFSDFSVTITSHNLTSESGNDCSSMGCIMMKGDDQDCAITNNNDTTICSNGAMARRNHQFR